METTREIERHFETLMSAIRQGKDVAPFLGAGACLCERAPEAGWTAPNSEFLPSGDELAKHLANDEALIPELARVNGRREIVFDLLKTAQYLRTMNRNRTLLEARVVEAVMPVEKPTCVHELCADLPSILTEKGYTPKLLFVTTNYDSLLERAFDGRRQNYDLVTFGTDKGGKLKFARLNGAEFSSSDCRKYPFFRDRPVIFKIHGSLAPCRGQEHNFVITEDDYLDFIVEFRRLLPLVFWNQIAKCRFLFLGYSLSDWNIRATFRALDLERRPKEMWAVVRDQSQFQRSFWADREVDVVSCPLAEYVEELRRRLKSLERIRC